ncbi:MAG: 50S ribosomal protein L30 [Candidatus Krumholzibacteriia bacterium]
MSSGKILVTQYRSIVGRPEKQRRVVRALGLRHNQTSVVHNDTPAIRGMVNKVCHLVRAEEVE